MSDKKIPSYTLWQMVRYMLKLGATGFGGPVALVGYMYRDLVEERRWVSESEYKEGLTLAQLAPGPLASQLAIYLGYCHYGMIGATLVGVAFALPSFCMVVALGAAYVRYGGLGWMQAVFYGVGACIIGIITRHAQKLAVKTMGKDKLLWLIASVLFIGTCLTEHESAALVLAAGFLVWFVAQEKVRNEPLKKIAIAAFVAIGILELILFYNAGSSHEITNQHLKTSGWLFLDMALFFGKAGAFVFGSGLAIIPFLFGGVVKQYAWLSDRQFLDAVAVAMITPGPVVITTGFIGYLVAGFWGACIAAFATFFPCYLFTIIPAPWMRRHGTHPAVVAVVGGVTSAAIAGAVVILGKRSITDITTAVIAVLTYGMLLKSKKIQEPVLIALSAMVGLLLCRFRP